MSGTTIIAQFFMSLSVSLLTPVPINCSLWCLVMVEWLFLAVPRGCLLFVIVVFPDHTHLLIFIG